MVRRLGLSTGVIVITLREYDKARQLSEEDRIFIYLRFTDRTWTPTGFTSPWPNKDFYLNQGVQELMLLIDAAGKSNH